MVDQDIPSYTSPDFMFVPVTYVSVVHTGKRMNIRIHIEIVGEKAGFSQCMHELARLRAKHGVQESVL